MTEPEEVVFKRVEVMPVMARLVVVACWVVRLPALEMLVSTASEELRTSKRFAVCAAAARITRAILFAVLLVMPKSEPGTGVEPNARSVN